jgi:hypothetical protein
MKIAWGLPEIPGMHIVMVKESLVAPLIGYWDVQLWLERGLGSLIRMAMGTVEQYYAHVHGSMEEKEEEALDAPSAHTCTHGYKTLPIPIPGGYRTHCVP